MKHSEQLQLDVVDELAYDSAVDSSRISVTASETGVVTLAGSVTSYMQARAAERAAKRVRGVHAVASKLDVNPPAASTREDTRIAEAALRALDWSASVPRDAVKVAVSDGWVALEGQVQWDYQRRAAGEAVHDLLGVKGVTNLISIKPSVAPEIQRRIEDAFKRNAQFDAAHVAVSVSGGRITLRGVVSSIAEKEAAERAAYAAPGVISVGNELEVKAHLFA
jgi:osmotically-inducible protein OsmY